MKFGNERIKKPDGLKPLHITSIDDSPKDEGEEIGRPLTEKEVQVVAELLHMPENSAHEDFIKGWGYIRDDSDVFVPPEARSGLEKMGVSTLEFESKGQIERLCTRLNTFVEQDERIEPAASPELILSAYQAAILKYGNAGAGELFDKNDRRILAALKRRIVQLHSTLATGESD